MERNGRIHTLSLDPGRRVYGERLLDIGGQEWREWSMNRSKPAAYLALGGGFLPLRPDSRMLYLGAASGTTASHFSDLLPEGAVFCLEFSPRTFRDLVRVCERRSNMMPILGDAASPSGFSFAVERVDMVYQDVAQKGQAGMLADNMDAFGADWGMLAVKARSEDVTASPQRVFQDACSKLEARGFKVRECLSLEPFEKDHAMVVVQR